MVPEQFAVSSAPVLEPYFFSSAIPAAKSTFVHLELRDIETKRIRNPSPTLLDPDFNYTRNSSSIKTPYSSTPFRLTLVRRKEWKWISRDRD
jgi:hypothetical protein